MKNKINTEGSALMKVLILTVIVAGLFTAYSLVRRSAFLSTNALVPKSVGGLDAVKSEAASGLVPIDLMLRTGSSESDVEAVSTVSLKVNITSKSASQLTITDQDGNPVTLLTPGSQFSQSTDWKFPVNNILSESGKLTIEFAAVNTGLAGYSAYTSERLTTFYVKGADSAEDVDLQFDKNNSLILTKRRPVTNIWAD